MKFQRSITGGSPSLLEYGLLDNPFFKDSKVYTNEILSNSEFFAEILLKNHGPIIREIVYPFNSNRYQKTPYIYIVLCCNTDLFY